MRFHRTSSLWVSPSLLAAMIWSPWRREIVLWPKLRTPVEASPLTRTSLSPTARRTWLKNWSLSRSPRSSPRNSPWHSDLVNTQLLEPNLWIFCSCFPILLDITAREIWKRRLYYQITETLVVFVIQCIQWSSSSPHKKPDYIFEWRIFVDRPSEKYALDKIRQTQFNVAQMRTFCCYYKICI